MCNSAWCNDVVFFFALSLSIWLIGDFYGERFANDVEMMESLSNVCGRLEW